MRKFSTQLFSAKKPLRQNLTKSAAVVMALSVGAGPLAAQDLKLGYGVAFTTNYVSNGITQTGNGPAVQPWAELNFRNAYLGFWGSNVEFAGVNDIEFDVSFGVRPSFGKLDLDIGFARYFYRDDKTDYGEAYILAKYNFTDTTWLNFEYKREVYANRDWVYLEGGFAGLPLDLAISGGIGTDFGSRNLANTYVAADIGIGKQLTKHSSFDLRATHSSTEGNHIFATLSFYK